MNKTLFNALIYKKNFQFIFKLFKGTYSSNRPMRSSSLVYTDRDGRTDGQSEYNTVQYC